MEHIVLGSGNLGIDLCERLSANNLSPESSLSWVYPRDGVLPIILHRPNVIWCCVGAGSVEGAKVGMPNYIDLHVRLTAELLSKAPQHTHLVFFSTDYVANELSPSDPEASAMAPRSLYAYSKLWLEQLVRATDRPRTVVIRLGSLYGNHFPERTFPGKIIKIAEETSSIELPINRVTPTPTWWIADQLAEVFSRLFARNRVPIHHLAPKGNVTTLGWARLFMPDKFAIKPKDIDMERPAMSYLGCSIPLLNTPDWSALWHNDKNSLK